MVERSRSVIFEPDGKIVEYEFTPLEIIAVPVLTEPLIQQQNIQDINEGSVVAPIQILEFSMTGQQNANSELSWSSFLLIFAVLCLAIYSMRTLVRRLRELQKDFLGFGSQQKTESLLSDMDMDDEWRMQRIENEALTRRNIQGSDGDFERVSNQSQITEQTSKRAAPEKVWPQKILFSPFRSKKPTVNNDDEFKRS